jgi:hypothetical protein
LKEERRLRVFENRVLRRIFGAKRDEGIGEWGKLHNEELTQYCLGDKIEKKWVGHIARMGEWRGVYSVLVEKPEGNRPLGRSRRRWEDNIKIDLQEMGRRVMDWFNLAQDKDRCRAFVKAVMNFPVP